MTLTTAQIYAEFDYFLLHSTPQPLCDALFLVDGNQSIQSTSR